jgi:hypothetical protein
MSSYCDLHCDIDCCEDAPVKPTLKDKIKKKKQETEMNYVGFASTGNCAVASCCSPQQEKQEKVYMVERLGMLKTEKEHDLRQKFGLDDDDAPRTAEEFLKRIEDKQFKLREKTGWLTSFYDRVQWRDPAKDIDQEGFDAAYEELMDVFANTMDEVVVLPEAEGLAALNEFKALN